MPRESPYVIILSREERRALESRARKYTLPYFQVVRALMILLAAEGHSNDRDRRGGLRGTRCRQPLAQALLL